MEIVERGVLSAAVPGTPRAVSTFPAFVVLADGSLLVTYSIGSGKDTDDLTIELRRSTDGGRTWTDPVTPFETTIDGRRGALKAAPITVLDGDHLIVAALWIDREAFPGQPLFNPETEGCLPMTVLLADSQDAGRTWTPWRIVPMPDDIGPPSLTNAILRLADGTLVLSIESNKPFLDTSKWFQRVVHLALRRRWGDLVRPGDGPRGSDRADPELGPAWRDRPGRPARDVHLDLRLGDRDLPQRPAPDQRRRHRAVRAGRRPRVRRPAGASGGPARRSRRRSPGSTGSGRRASAPGRPTAIDAPFDAATEVVVHRPGDPVERPSTTDTTDATATGEILVDMGTWSYGLAFAEALPDGDVGVVHYAAGADGGTDVRWARLRLDR